MQVLKLLSEVGPDDIRAWIYRLSLHPTLTASRYRYGLLGLVAQHSTLR